MIQLWTGLQQNPQMRCYLISSSNRLSKLLVGPRVVNVNTATVFAHILVGNGKMGC